VNYWLLALPPEHIEHCITIGTFGLNRKHIMGRVKTGDKVACYAHKDRKIIGLGEATSDYYVDEKRFLLPKATSLTVLTLRLRGYQLMKKSISWLLLTV